MTTTPLRRGTSRVGAAVAAACAVLGWLTVDATAALAQAASCQPVFAAAARQVALPLHMYMTQTGGATPGKTIRSETIHAGGAIYVQVNGTWSRSHMTVQELQQQEAENQRNAKGTTCRYLRDEAVNGQAAAVYSERTADADSKTDATVWISKSQGVPLRVDMDMDVGGPGGKSHYTTRYEYGAVQPPPGVR